MWLGISNKKLKAIFRRILNMDMVPFVRTVNLFSVPMSSTGKWLAGSDLQWLQFQANKWKSWAWLADMFNTFCFYHAAAVFLSYIRLFVTAWAVAYQATEFSRQGYWNWLSFLTRGYLPDLEIKPTSPALAGILSTTVSSEKLFCFHI